MGASRYDHLIEIGLNHATRDGKQGRQSTGVRAWFAFLEEEGGLLLALDLILVAGGR